MKRVLVVLALLAGAARAEAPAPQPAPAEAPAKKKKAELMDINAATADQLKTLPGITDEIAQKIIAGRPYKGKDALLKNGTLDKDAYGKVRPLIVAHQPKADTKPATTATPAPSPPPAQAAPAKPTPEHK